MVFTTNLFIDPNLIFKGPSAEVELIKGQAIKVTTNESYSKKGSNQVIYVDYKNIIKVLVPGNRVYIEDGLMSLVVKQVGQSSRASVL